MGGSHAISSPEVAPAAENIYAQKLRPYAIYALVLLVGAQFFNYVDRQIVSIVGERMKEDLALTDAQLGFLYGTAFTVLFSISGMAIGRISDNVNRPRLMGVGLGFWSLMTALCGAATNFAQVAAARIGVGVGEGSTSPVTQSMAADYLPARHRSVALGSLSFGSFLGVGASLAIGGLVLENWDRMCRQLPFGACHVADWQAAFLVVGLPGLLFAILISNLKDPVRPGRKVDTPLGRLVFNEVSAVAPPLTLFNLFKAGGRRAVLQNLTFIGVLAALVLTLSSWLGDWAQWVGAAIAIYAISSWGHSLQLRDRPLFMLTYGCPTFKLVVALTALVSCVNNTIKIWIANYAIRELGVSAVEAGVSLGIGLIIGGGLGVAFGSWATDRWKQTDKRAPIYMSLISLIGPIPALIVMMTTADFTVFVIAFVVFATLAQCFGGGMGALAQDLLLPRMRGSGAAAYATIVVLFAAIVGPYWAGKVSTVAGSLAIGMLSLLVLVPVAIVVAVLCAKRVVNETAEARLARAAQYGEA